MHFQLRRFLFPGVPPLYLLRFWWYWSQILLYYLWTVSKSVTGKKTRLPTATCWGQQWKWRRRRSMFSFIRFGKIFFSCPRPVSMCIHVGNKFLLAANSRDLFRFATGCRLLLLRCKIHKKAADHLNSSASCNFTLFYYRAAIIKSHLLGWSFSEIIHQPNYEQRRRSLASSLHHRFTSVSGTPQKLKY